MTGKTEGVGQTAFAYIALILLAVILSTMAAPASAAEGKRVALVIGNADYEHVSTLSNPANDAADLARKLTGIGFEVTTGLDLDYTGMRLAVRDFTAAAAGADVVLIYFAGHGIEIENTNYLIPVNATLKSDRDVEFEAIRLDAVVNAVSDTGGLKVILVDACRNNPFLSQMSRTGATRSIGNGLAAIEPGGVVVGYAARGGTLAQDGDGRNSPYAAALLEYIDEPGLELGKLFRKVRDRVYRTTDGFQEPFTYGSLPGEDIFLVPPVEKVAMPAPAPVSRTAVPGQAAPATPFEAAAKVNTLRGWSLYARSTDAGAFTDPAVLEHIRAMTPAWIAAGNERVMEEFLLPDREARQAFQAALNAAGADVGTPDGVFGPKTRAGIRLVQENAGLPETGVAGPALLATLDMALAEGTDGSFISAPFATRHNPVALRMIGEDPQIADILGCLGLRKSVYGVYEGRLYVAVVRSGSVEAARAEAQKCGLDLASVTSAEENAFVVRLFSSDPGFVSMGYDSKTNTSYKSGPYFGLRKDRGENNAVIGWRWFSGEPVRYENWLPGKPDQRHGRGDKHYAQYQYERRGRADLSSVQATQWFDGAGIYGHAVILEGDL